MSDFPDKSNFRINEPDLYNRLFSTEEARLLYMGAPDYIPEELTWPVKNPFIKPAGQKNSIPFKYENKQIGKITDVGQDDAGIYVSGYIYDERAAKIILGEDTIAGYSIGSIGEKPRRTSMEEKIVKWLKEHRRDLVIVTVTALVTAKLAKGGRMVTVEKDGYVFNIPKEIFKQL